MLVSFFPLFPIQVSHPYSSIDKIIDLYRFYFTYKVIFVLVHILSRLTIGEVVVANLHQMLVLYRYILRCLRLQVAFHP